MAFTGILVGTALFVGMWAVMMFFAKPRAIALPTLGSVVASYLIWTALVKSALVYIFIDPTDKLLSGATLTNFEWSGVVLFASWLFMILITVVQAIQNWNEKGILQLTE